MLLFIIISSLSMVFIKITTKPIEFEHFILLVLLSWPSNRKTRNRARATPIVFQEERPVPGLQLEKRSAISDLRLVNELNARDRADIASK